MRYTLSWVVEVASLGKWLSKFQDEIVASSSGGQSDTKDISTIKEVSLRCVTNSWAKCLMAQRQIWEKGIFLNVFFLQRAL